MCFRLSFENSWNTSSGCFFKIQTSQQKYCFPQKKLEKELGVGNFFKKNEWGPPVYSVSKQLYPLVLLRKVCYLSLLT